MCGMWFLITKACLHLVAWFGVHMNGFNLVTANKITANDFVSELFALNLINVYCNFRPYLNKCEVTTALFLS